MTLGARRTVLILCTANSCRSQMAEGFLLESAGDRFNVISAGLRPADEVHPLAIQVMAERNIDISRQRPKSVAQFLGRISVNYLIIVCPEAEDNCPRIFPGMLHRLRWPFDDPAITSGGPELILEKFRSVRDEIEERVATWLTTAP